MSMFNLIFSESTCSKIRNQFFLRALLGQQVPQHDVNSLLLMVEYLWLIKCHVCNNQKNVFLKTLFAIQIMSLALPSSTFKNAH
jgi:hypothetical protein